MSTQMVGAEEVARALTTSESYAYKVIRKFNDSEFLRERLKLPEQIVQPHRGQELGPVYLLEHRLLEAVVCFNCLAVSQRGPDRGYFIHLHRFSCLPIRGCSPRQVLPYSPRSAPLQR